MTEPASDAEILVFVKSLLDAIWNRGHTPKLVVDATHPSVYVPDFVRRQWGTRLALHLEAVYPMVPSFDDDALRVTLAFQGTTCRCVFPWKSIYLIADRETGQGAAITSNMPRDIVGTSRVPKSVVETVFPTGANGPKTDPAPPPVAPKKPSPFRVIKGGKKD